jgi:hypothetical protein
VANRTHYAKLEAAEAVWSEAMGKVEEERDELRGRLLFRLAHIKELKCAGGQGRAGLD